MLPKALFIALLLMAQGAEASNRWQLLRWCTTFDAANQGRCEGFLQAAVDLHTSAELPGIRICFSPDTRLEGVRQAVVSWLRDHPTSPEKNGLALASRALRESYPCQKAKP